MKKILLASTMLVSVAGFAAADVSVSGDGRMGVVSDFGADYVEFTSRMRIKFSGSGTTDGGMSFGGSFRAKDASGANSGTSGSVYMSGSFGKISMGDVDDAAQAIVGHVSGVGLTGLGDYNELYIEGNGDTPAVLYEYGVDSLSLAASVDQNDGYQIYSLAAKYVVGDYALSAGYETEPDSESGWSNIVLGADAKFGAVDVKARYASESYWDDADNEYAVSATYTADTLALTAFTAVQDHGDHDVDNFGLGATYNLGGGASVAGGFVNTKDGSDAAESAWDLGVNFSF